MATTDDGRAVQGGPAIPVVVINQSLPGNAPTGTQDVHITAALPAGTNNIGDMDVLSVAGVTQLPTTLGQKTAANSLSTVLASDQGAVPVSVADGADVALGAKADAAASSDAGTFSLIALFKRLLGKLPTIGQQTRAASLSVTQASDATGANAPQMQGTAADGAAVAGNPVLVAGIDGSGNAQTIATETSGIQRIALYSAAGVVATFANSQLDSTGNGAATIATQPFTLIFNGASWDRFRNNEALTILASAARTATTNSTDQINYNGRRLELYVNISAGSGFSLTPSLQAKDPVSGTYKTVWTAAAPLTATGLATYLFAAPASGGSYTEIIQTGLAMRTFRVVMTALDATPATYSVAGVVGV